VQPTLFDLFFFSSRRRHTRSKRDWSSDVCSSDLKWSQKVFPNVSEEEAVTKMWESILSMSRIDQGDPVDAWNKHNETLRKAREVLTNKQYDKLIFTGPGTNLELGLA